MSVVGEWREGEERRKAGRGSLTGKPLETARLSKGGGREMSTLPYALGVVSIHTEVATMLNNYQSSQHYTCKLCDFF